MTGLAALSMPGTSRDPGPTIFSPTVRAMQARLGSRANYERMELASRFRQEITPDLAGYLAARNSIYVATASADGQPYIQHRGGPPGFIKILDAKTLGFADFSGNKQYISVGNLSENPRAFLFVIDYALQRRIKLWGRAEVVEGDAVLLQKLMPPGYQARPERAILFHLDLWAINCPQHIRQRVTADEIAPVLARYEARIEELEAEVKKLRQG